MRPSSYHTYTADELAYMQSHCGDAPKEVAAIIGAPIATVADYMQRFRNGTFARRRRTDRRYYALYLKKTDELICCGDAKECAEQLGITAASFTTMAWKIRHGKIAKYDIYIEPFNGTEEF